MPAQRPPKRGAEIFRDWLLMQGADADLISAETVHDIAASPLGQTDDFE